MTITAAQIDAAANLRERLDPWHLTDRALHSLAERL
jgi:hypothetical protein